MIKKLIILLLLTSLCFGSGNVELIEGRLQVRSADNVDIMDVYRTNSGAFVNWISGELFFIGGDITFDGSDGKFKWNNSSKTLFVPNIDAGTISIDIIDANTVTVGDLTETRVVFAGASGLLADDADLTFVIDTLFATNLTSSGTVLAGAMSIDSVGTDAVLTMDGTSNDPGTLTYESDNALFILDKDVQMDLGLTVDTTTLVVNAAGYTDKVGIGTATPGSPFHVAKEMSDHTPLVLLENLGTNSGEGDVLDVYTRRADGFTDGYIAQFRNIVGTKVYIRGDGNVGIGTTEPTSKLHIFSPDAADSWNQAHIALVTISNLDMNADQSEALLVRGGANNALTQVFEVQDYSGNADFTVWGDGEVTMNGNVGIGLTTVNDNYKLIIRRAANVNLGVGLQGSELAIAAFNDALSANIPMRFYASEYNLLNGNVGINVTDPDVKLEIFGAATQLKLSYDATNYTTFTTGSDGDLTITTVDSDGAAGDITLAPDGVVDVTSGLSVNTGTTAGVGLSLRGTGTGNPRGGVIKFFKDVGAGEDGFLFINENSQLVGKDSAQSSSADTGVFSLDFDSGNVLSSGTGRFNSGVGIGTDPSSSIRMVSLNNVNGNTLFKMENTNSGTSAQARFSVHSDVAVGIVSAYSSTRSLTRFGQAMANYVDFVNAGGDGMAIGTTGTGEPVFIGTENIRAIKIDGSNQDVLIGLDDTNHTKISTTGDLTFHGTAGLIFGHMDVPAAAVITVDTSGDANPVEVKDDGTGSANDGWETGILNGTVFATSDLHYITVTIAGTYKVIWDMSPATNSGGGTEIHGGITKDTTTFVRNNGEAHAHVFNNNDNIFISAVGVIDCPNGNEEISLWISNDAGQKTVIEHGNMYIQLIGGT